MMYLDLFSPVLARILFLPNGLGIFLLIFIVFLIVAGINKRWGRQINGAAARMASAWMRGRQRK